MYDGQGVYIPFSPLESVLECQNAVLTGICARIYRPSFICHICLCQNQYGTGIKGTSLIPECSGIENEISDAGMQMPIAILELINEGTLQTQIP